MRLTAWEQERLLIFTAAELARRHRERGLRLNHPEAVAIICDAVLDAARGGASYEEAVAAGYAALRPADVMDGVRELLDEVRLEVLLAEGTRLIVLVDPLGAGPAAEPDAAPAWVRLGTAAVPSPPERETKRVTVRNTSRRAVRVSSHHPFDRVNRRLVMDRDAVRGFRLDLPSGATLLWAPGEEREVTLVRYGGTGGERVADATGRG